MPHFRLCEMNMELNMETNKIEFHCAQKLKIFNFRWRFLFSKKFRSFFLIFYLHFFTFFGFSFCSFFQFLLLFVDFEDVLPVHRLWLRGGVAALVLVVGCLASDKIPRDKLSKRQLLYKI